MAVIRQPTISRPRACCPLNPQLRRRRHHSNSPQEKQSKSKYCNVVQSTSPCVRGVMTITCQNFCLGIFPENRAAKRKNKITKSHRNICSRHHDFSVFSSITQGYCQSNLKNYLSLSEVGMESTQGFCSFPVQGGRHESSQECDTCHL